MRVRSGFDFDEKYDLYHKMVYKICVTYLGNKQDDENVLLIDIVERPDGIKQARIYSASF